jgi:hypothetical protein
MASFFIDLFANAAGSGQTHLQQKAIVELLKAADLGLTFIQIHSILSEVSGKKRYINLMWRAKGCTLRVKWAGYCR